LKTLYKMMTGPGLDAGAFFVFGALRTRHCLRASYLRIMQFQPAIPTRGTKVPATPRSGFKGRTTDDA
jgi:hypothetical protein